MCGHVQICVLSVPEFYLHGLGHGPVLNAWNLFYV